MGGRKVNVPYWIATGTKDNRFAADLSDNADVVHAQVSGKRVLLVGGAGSIGSATLRALLAWEPREIVVADIDENGLAELGRDLAASGMVPACTALRLVAVDYGAPAMRRLLDGGVDLALNFAALKHVHSERDLVSLLQMIDTNLLKQARFMGWLKSAGCGRYFNVSTDKAADPRCFMGATKRAQETLLWGLDAGCPTSSARFANVAFSRGSVLDIWTRRLPRGQALTATRGIRRHFMSTYEAGTLCLLASTCTPPATLLVPDLGTEDEVELHELAQAFMTEHGRPLVHLETREPEPYEKASESFVGNGEELLAFGARTSTIRASKPALSLPAWINELARLCDDKTVDKPTLHRALAYAAPGFEWRAQQVADGAR
jgi:FlaA1/EpsC-like NDP-sugar epimerase